MKSAESMSERVIGLVIVTHGGLAREFLAAMEHVVGPQRNVAAVCIEADDDMERRRRDILTAASAVDEGAGVILLTDMFGGTPSNLAISTMEETRAEVLCGINLPMLIKLAGIRGREPFEACVAQAVEAGRKYIAAASWLLKPDRAAG
jgi:mannose PTS system EIIA component